MKGIILAGGSGSRLYPLTAVTSKQLLPIHDKPMIYFPLSILMLAGIRDILIISTPKDLPNYQRLFGDGSSLGIEIKYAIQEKPQGLAQAFLIGENFIGDDDVCLILGDNLLHGAGLKKMLEESLNWVQQKNEAVVYGYPVKKPKEFGIAHIQSNGKVISIEEKPIYPKSNLAVIGLYFYPNDVVKKAKCIKPSKRGELEISSINQLYVEEGKIHLQKLGRGFTWFDTGTISSYSRANEFVRVYQSNTDLQIACLEEISITLGLIKETELKNQLKKMGQNEYSNYLRNMINKS